MVSIEVPFKEAEIRLQHEVFLAIFRNEIMTILTTSTSEGESGAGGGGGGDVFHFGGP